MVILIRCEMDGDGHRSGKKSGLLKWVIGRSSRPSPTGPRRSSARQELFPPTERRPLRSVPLVGPHYRVEPEILVSEFVEKEVKFLGTVGDLDSNFDASDRASLLKIVDEQQALDFLPSHLSYENDIIVSFSVHNIKLLRRDGEKLIHRIQTHKIAAVGYVRDDNRHLVFMKFASELNSKMCNLAILCCDSKTAAEEVCSLAQQVFQLVYTDSTIDFLDKSIQDGAVTPKNHSYSTDDSDKKDAITVQSEDYSQYSLHQNDDSVALSTTSHRTNGRAALQESISKRRSLPIPDLPPGLSSTLPQPVRYLRHRRRSGSSGSSNNNVPLAAASTLTLTSPSSSTQRFPVHGELQIQDYLRVLKEQLSNVELKEFAQLLNQFRTGGTMISEFSDKLLQLYTEKRKHLLLGMRHFIPNSSDLSFFNNFLKEHNVEEIPAESSPTSWWAQAPHTAPRTSSETEESNTSAAGNITAVSLSSSGSDRASVSVVSNDGSGEWKKNVIENIERLGIYPSTDSSAADVNGTPPNVTAVLVDSAFVVEDSITQVHVPVAAAVPEEFRDSDENSVERESSFSSIKKSPIKAVELESSNKARKEKRNSKSDSVPTRQVQDCQRTLSEQPPGKPLPGSSELSSLPKSRGGMSQPHKAQKDHRKKKKHKKDDGGSDMF